MHACNYSTIFSSHKIIPTAGDGCDDTGTCKNASLDKSFLFEKANSIPTSTAILSNGKSYIYMQTYLSYLGYVGSANFARPQRPALYNTQVIINLFYFISTMVAIS